MNIQKAGATIPVSFKRLLVLLLVLAGCSDSQPMVEETTTECSDQDADLVCDVEDNCPDVANSDQADVDGDLLGDACALELCDGIDNTGEGAVDEGLEDLDLDGIADCRDECPDDRVNDPDGDLLCATVDNCPEFANADQNDSDSDQVGDVCDAEECDGRDNDGDGVVDEDYADNDATGGADCWDDDLDGFSEEQDDCDDANTEINPAALELWYDDVDSDCNGELNPPVCDDPPPAYFVDPLADCEYELEPHLLALCDTDCTSLQLVLEIINYGVEPTPDGLSVLLYGIDGLGRYSVLIQNSLAAIGSRSSSGGLIIPLGNFDGLYPYTALELSIDDSGGFQGAVDECDESNNIIPVVSSQFLCSEPAQCDVPPPAESISSDSQCSYTPVPGEFSPEIKWQKSEFIAGAYYDQVASAPVVGNLTDDNGDGRVDSSDIPDIVFTTFLSALTGEPGYLRAISGADGAELWSAFGPNGSAGVSLGDLEGDGFPEVVTIGEEGRVVAYDNAGELKWTCYAEASYYGYPAIGDLDGDGLAEVVVNRTICDHEGNRQDTSRLDHGRIPIVVDLDQDGSQEIVSGAGVSNADGSTRWTGLGGYAAVADFDGDAVPEVVTAYEGQVALLDNTGTAVWTVAHPGGGSGGPPAIADVDGDGELEIIVAGELLLVAFDEVGNPVWQLEILEQSSSSTAVSTFDFDGNGAAEVVFADETTLYILDGSTGGVLWRDSDHASVTINELPSIADVNGDGEVEIVLASSNVLDTEETRGWTGITVIGEATHQWINGRPVWAQHAWFDQLVDDNLKLINDPIAFWTLPSPGFRKGLDSATGKFAAADLSAVLVEACEDACPTARLLFKIKNSGAKMAPAGIPITLFGEGTFGRRTVLATIETTDPVRPGWTSNTLEVLVEESSNSYFRLILAVDDGGSGAGVEPECDEADNELVVPFLCTD